MAAALDKADPIRKLDQELTRMANAQFDSDGFKRLLSLRLNKERARMYIIQRTHWTVNRRDCWAQVQSSAPLPVKKLIWDHEREELEGDVALGKPDRRYTRTTAAGTTAPTCVGACVTARPHSGCAFEGVDLQA